MRRTISQDGTTEYEIKIFEKGARSLLSILGICSVLFLSLPRSEGWPHHGRTFSIYLYPLSF